MASARKDFRTYTVGGMGSSFGSGRLTPVLRLQGLWLQELGFQIGDSVKVKCEDGRLIITPDQERMLEKEAEQAFMERETQKLREQFRREKEGLVAMMVAEKRAEYKETEGGGH